MPLIWYKFDTYSTTTVKNYGTKGAACDGTIVPGNSSPYYSDNTGAALAAGSTYTSMFKQTTESPSAGIISVPTPSYNKYNGVTVTLWMYFRSYSGGSDSIFARIGLQGIDDLYGVSFAHTSVRGSYIYTGLGNPAPKVPIVLNTWMHITLTYTYSGTVSFYKDGAIYETGTRPQLLDTLAGISLFGIGATYHSMNGGIRDFRYYNSVLTPEYITQIYNGEV